MTDLREEFIEEMALSFLKTQYVKMIWENDIEALKEMKQDIERYWVQYLVQATRQGIEIVDDNYCKYKAHR